MKTKLRTCLFAMVSLILLTALLVHPSSVRADSTITVNRTFDTIVHDGDCTLREAILNANTDSDTTSGDCLAGSGNDTIVFDSGLGVNTITLGSTLPNIVDVDGLTINGDNRITLSGNDSVRVLYVSSGALLTLQNISVTHGSTTQGGGLYNDGGTVIISHSVFSNNSASNGGGGVMNNGGTLTITNSTFSSNSATSDGGGVANGGALTITNSTFSNNSANYGGGVMNNSATATILNSTFSGNSATLGGGGVATNYGGATPPTTTIRNTILANSVSGGDCYTYGTGTLIGDHNIIETPTTCTSIATITSDPDLGSLTGSPAYFPLNGTSPAIDAGDEAVCAAAPVSNTSQNGVARSQGVHCDIGAYEKSQIIVNYTADNSTSSDGWCTLREAINNANTDSDTTSGDCTAGSGYDNIVFAGSAGPLDITLTSSLPDIVDNAGLTIDGDNRITLSGNGSVRVLYVDAGWSGGGFKLQNISVTHGSATEGGGLINSQGKVTITHSVFSNNNATNVGGGVANAGTFATLTITDSTFSNNSATNDGGGVDNNTGSTLTIANSTFSNNSADNGGGVENINSTLTLLNSTFSGNSATSGATVGTWNSSIAPTTTIRNTIIANSISGVDCWNDVTGILTGGNNIIETTGSGGNSCSAITASSADPMLALSLTGSPAYFSLNYGSPAIDAGDDVVCAAPPVKNESQNGVTRPQGAHCDIGSFEKLPNLPPTKIVLSSSSVAENQPIGTTVGTLTTTDPDSGDTHTYSFTCATPGADDASFQIGGAGNDELQTAAMFDYETKNTYDICIRTDDGHGGTFDKAFTIDITDVPGLELLLPLNGATLHYNRPTFDWADFSGATGYQIQVSKNSTFTLLVVNASTGASNSTYTPTSNLPANTLLYWRVRAKLGAAKSAWSSAWTLHTGTPPSIPSLLAPANNALTMDLTPLLDWTQSTGATFDHYQIQLADNADFTGAVDVDIAGAANHAYTPTVPLNTNTKYYWHVRSWNTGGDYSAWAARTFREAMLPPGLVAPVGGITVGDRKPVLDWDDVIGATNYKLQVSLNNSFTSLVLNLNVTPSTYTPIVNLAANKLFYWRVKALGPNGPSAWSAVETFHTP